MNSYKFSNKLVCCDAVAGLETLPDESIPLVVTSPPWDDRRKFGGHSWNFKAVANHLWRVIRQGGVVCWHVADQVKAFSETLTSFRQALYFQELGFLVNTIVVDAYTPGTRQFRYGNAVQFVFVLSKGKPNVFNPISDVPNETAGKVKIFHSRDANGDSHHSSPKIVKPYRVKDAVWPCSNGGHSDRDLTRFHPAVFNERLVQDLIRSYSVAGNVVLDCFSGVGTTAKIALLNNRRYLGFEIHQLYHDLAVKRLERAIEHYLAVA